MDKIIFASTNKGKIKEVTAILQDRNVEISSLIDFPKFPEIAETGKTFEENARIKAQAVYEHFNLPVIADDSGLCVDQLDGRPGVYSARYAGKNADDRANNEKLIRELSLFPEPHKARYVCAAVFYNGEEFFIAQDYLEGRIIKNPAGTHGFGYDPFFVAEGFEITMAQLHPDEKNKISHRYKAFNKLKTAIK